MNNMFYGVGTKKSKLTLRTSHYFVKVVLSATILGRQVIGQISSEVGICSLSLITNDFKHKI